MALSGERLRGEGRHGMFAAVKTVWSMPELFRGEFLTMERYTNLSLSPCIHQARFPFKRNRLCCVRCVNENRKKRERLRWQAANHGCHCFDWAFLLAGACVCCLKIAFLAVFVYATHATQAIAFEWKPGLIQSCCGYDSDWVSGLQAGQQ